MAPAAGMDIKASEGDITAQKYSITPAEQPAPEDIEPPAQGRRIRRGWLYPLWWYLEWALPGLGMFSEAYIIFSAGQVGPFQKAMWPSCYVKYIDCDKEMVAHLANYIQICGIMAGMLLWGFLGDFTGRMWGSRFVAAIMLSGCILLTFTPWATTAYGYFAYFMTAQTWYGFGVGGEYPMAASSAAERSATTPELRHLRGQQVILVFSGQGAGNLVNCSIFLISMAIFGQTGPTLTFTGSQHVLALTYGIGALCCLFMVVYRFMFLKESEMYVEEKKIEGNLKVSALRTQMVSLYYYWPRQFIASGAWIANDFAFYGNKLQQNQFISKLYPDATPYVKQQWTVLNSFIALLGYYLAAFMVDKPWYGRRWTQIVGFVAMFIFYIVIYGQWDNMHASASGMQAFQAMYYLSSFFNQFGPNATTWLVAGEMFPTDIRTGYHGFAACMGKLGAIIASLWISYIPLNSQENVFLISAIWGIGGAVFTWIFQPETAGLDLEELDRMQRCAIAGRFQDYHGEAVNPKHLSPYERYVMGWHKNYNPELDRIMFESEMKEFHLKADQDGSNQMKRMSMAAEVTVAAAADP